MREELIDLLSLIDASVLGARLRTRRLQVGLTQAQLAGDKVSVGYISRIESGQRRPDAALLQALSEKLSVTPDELLQGVSPDRLAELQVMLDHAELHLATGSEARALAIATDVLDDEATSGLPHLLRSAGYIRAAALEASGDLQTAILHLEDLADTLPRDLRWIDGLTMLCRCYRESGELGRAIEVGTQGLRLIEELELGGVDEAIKLNLSLAAAYHVRGDVDYAARMCQRALNLAETMASPVAKAMAYWNSSKIESLRGNASSALPLARRALEIIEAGEDARSVARLRTELGVIQLKIDPPQAHESLATLRRAAAELITTDAGVADRAENQIAQGRAKFMLGDSETARSHAEAASTLISGTAPLLSAEASALLGRISLHENAIDLARSHFHDAVLQLSLVGADRAAAQLWFELAHLLEGIGDASGALDAYRRAAAATGLVTSALPLRAPVSAR